MKSGRQAIVQGYRSRFLPRWSKPMRMAMSLWKSSIAAAMLLAAGGAAFAQAKPDTENGRYALSPTGDGGMLRLDTKTGTVSTCSNSGTGWACYVVPDERAAYDQEIGRLQADNQKSKAEIEKLKTELASRAPVACRRQAARHW